MADVACPSGYTQVIEDVVYMSSGNSCPNGDTKLGGEYGEDSILNCIGAQSDAVPICTYFAESCQPGMSFDGMTHQSCPYGAYYCDGSGTAMPGVAGCSSVCPTPRNTVGAASINPEARQDLNGNDLYDSINECGVLYMFLESWALPLVGVEATDTYKPDSDANVRGNAYVYCAYNSETDEYDINCVGYPLFCAGGYYSSGWGSDTHENKFEEGVPIYGMSGSVDSDNLTGTLSLDEFIQVYCEPVGENYWSESGEDLFNADLEGEELYQRTLGRTPCPANSSTKGATTATYCTCNDGYTVTGTIGGNIQTTTDACRPIPEFSIITTSMDAGTEFSFSISAAGEYTIDWGDGTVESIVKTDTNDTTYSHIYTSGGVHTIGIGGDATEYYTSPNGNSHQPAISFANNTNIAKLVGSLGAIFGGSAEWMFSYTFSNCTSLTEIPENLFSGQRSGADRMFYGTFSGCTSLIEVPANLFSGITDSAEYMFYYTFDGCTSLTKIAGNPFPNLTGNAPGMFNQTFSNCTLLNNIPKDLFAGVSGSATDMFNYTFANCTSLTNIPKELFSGISGGAEGMFSYTFHNCTSLVDIPATLFSGINTSAYQMFNQTFRNCTSLTEIPGTLFQNIKGESAQEVFSGTFANCTSLTSIPNGLFKNITGKPAEYAFSGTFYECTNLTGTVPVDLFENLDSADYVSGPMEFIFNGTNLDTQCPSGTYQYITGFESDWDGHVACTPCPSTHPNSVAGATYESQCYTTCEQQCTPQECPENATCTHGTTTTTGKEYVGTACDASASQCEITITCNSGYSLTDGECVSDDFDAEFTITTTNIPANESFWFYLSAAGTYKVNWGDGNIEKIEKTNTTNELISHIYATSGTYEIKLAGDAIRYNSDSYNNVAAIRFSYDDTDVIGNPYLKTISGSLGKIFPTLSSSTNGKLQPSFRRLFTNCENLTGAIPAELFSGVYGTPLGRMFMAAFMNTQITEQLPSDLFSGLDGQISENLFRETFSGCTELTGTIPADLFGNLSGDLQTRTFYHTFYGCEKLTGYVPKTLFAKFSRSNESNQMTDVFYNTGLATYCPANEYVYDTGFNDLFSSRVACTPCPDTYPNSDTGATSESQCYVTCTKQCTQQTCPENSVNCTHGNEISSGYQYYGSSCNATEIVCDIDFSCSVGYDKLSFADTLVRNMDAIYDSAEYDDYCQLNNTGNSCDTLSAGQYMWYFDTSNGSPISSGQVQTTCTDDMGNDTDPQSRINYNADFNIQSSGANCWERVLYLNDSPVSSSWIYNKTYDSAEDCAAYCGFSKPMSVGYALAVATNANLCAPHEYTVTYDCNDGTGNATDTATYKTTFTPRKDVCERNGYKFIGWTLNDASVSDSFVWDYTNDQTLIATWKQMSAECKPGEYLPANATECKLCEENNYCPGGTYNIGTTDIGMNPCHDGSMSNSGATHITQCYINKPCGKYTDITTVCTYNTDTSDFTDCAECSIDTSCPYNQELVNGKCTPCNRDNALDYHKTGNCMVSECEQGFYPYMQQCMSEKIECDAPKANVAYKYWDIANRAYGPCIITECIDDEYHIEANACVPNIQSCDVEHGIGEQEWDFEQNKWGTCVAVQCDSGYTTDQSLTNDTLNGQCGRCSNMYVDDELAVSTYISECEIASCMYQGEKYILENNECVLICDERSDETGSRYWNGKKCVHECAEGYSIWE